MATKTTYHCDICGVEIRVSRLGIAIPVCFTTEQTEGTPITPKLSMENLDLCLGCEEKLVEALPLWGSGAQGHNKYWWKGKG